MHVEFGAAVAAVEGADADGEDAFKEFLSEQLVGATRGDDTPGRVSELGAQAADLGSKGVVGGGA